MQQQLVETAPVLSLKERDRRWEGLRAQMRRRDLDAIVVGSFQGRERLESYLIDDFLDSVIVLAMEGDAVVMTFATGRLSRTFESERQGIALWTHDYRIGFGGAKAAEVLKEKKLAGGRIGLVGLGPTAPGETEGLIPLGFHTNLVAALPGASFHDFTNDFTTFMLTKSDEELALLRHAAKVTERACQVMADVSRPGVSEAVVYAEVMREIYASGCDVRYPFLSLQSGVDNIGWGVPRWTLRAEPPRILCRGDVIQAEIHTIYGGQEAQVQMCVALDPIDAELQKCETVARASYEAGLNVIKPGVTFGEVVAAMAAPIKASGCWSKTPLLHTLTFGSTGFTAVNREQLAGTREAQIEGAMTPGVRRADLVLTEGMGLELEPNACIGMRRINIGSGVVVGRSGPEELNDICTRVWHVKA
jgi:Xaa-Pro aminopeptidase